MPVDEMDETRFDQNYDFCASNWLMETTRYSFYTYKTSVTYITKICDITFI